MKNRFLFFELFLFLNLEFVSSEISNDLQLIFVHAAWRHGDRSAANPQGLDIIKENEWISGGGGYGQLSAKGMAEMFKLGQLLRQRYIKDIFPQFLHPFYDSKEIYIRSTDTNRTINSAVATMIGMFSSNNSDARPDVDYPAIEGWPKGFMPVPVHAPVKDENDYLLNTYISCKRMEYFSEIGRNTKQYLDFIHDETFIKTTKTLTEIYKVNVTAENLYKFTDALKTELIHFPNKLKAQPWYSDELIKTTRNLQKKANRFETGLFDPPIINGTNLRREILKTKSGFLINEISSRMRSVANCWKNNKKCDETLKKLKFYAYSAHDHTLASLMNVLGMEDVVEEKGKIVEGPEYAACIIFELFANKTDKRLYFRTIYHRNVNETFEVVTKHVNGCEKNDFCDLKIFENRAKEHRPEASYNEFCQMIPGEIKTTNSTIPKSAFELNSSKKQTIQFILPILLIFLF